LLRPAPSAPAPGGCPEGRSARTGRHQFRMAAASLLVAPLPMPDVTATSHQHMHRPSALDQPLQCAPRNTPPACGTPEDACGSCGMSRSSSTVSSSSSSGSSSRCSGGGVTTCAPNVCAESVRVSPLADEPPLSQLGLLPPLLPPQAGAMVGRKTLVLDLDQTLVECLHMREAGASPPDFIYTDAARCRAQVWVRPHLAAFLETAAAHFEVVLFTAAPQQHADAVLAELDPGGALFAHRLYGHHTTSTPQWAYVKDLSRLGRDPCSTLLVVSATACV